MKLKNLSNERLIVEHADRHSADAEWPDLSASEMDVYKKRVEETKSELLRRIAVSAAKDDVVKWAKHVDSRLKTEEVALDILDPQGYPCGDAGELLSDALAKLEKIMV